MSFDVLGPLPAQPTLLEASAGTGKTWTMAALALRYVAEDALPIRELACVTFTRKAAAELRQRIFTGLQDAQRALRGHLADGSVPDEVVAAHLCLSDVEVRLARVDAALAQFDEAQVGTIHDFCHGTLRELGVIGDWDAGDRVLGDTRSLAEECGSDVYLERYQAAAPPYPPDKALEVARQVCATTMPLHTSNDEQRAYAEAVRQRYRHRKRQLGVIDFDDMVARLADVLANPVTGRLAGEVMRKRAGVVMVDEFQDTDPVQWSVLRTAFVDEGGRVILIGDPKQSIYGFRSADLICYTEAARLCQTVRLGKNWRSDPPLVQGVAELFGSLRLGADDIRVTAVECSHDTARLDVPAPSRVWVRQWDRSGDAPAAAVDNDVVRQCRAILERARIRPGEEQQQRDVSPDDIAILVRTAHRGRALQQALVAHGIPAVFTGSIRALQTPAAGHWLTLLQALESPGRAEVLRAALTPLLGHDLDALLDHNGLVRASIEVLGLRRLLEAGGIPGVMAHLMSTGLPERLASTPDGPDDLVNLQHVAELLAESGAHTVADQVRLLQDAGGGEEDGSAEVRLASSSPAVRILTMHSAKGLEFGIVLLPEVSDLPVRLSRPLSVVIEARRQLHIGDEPPYDSELAGQLTAALREEELRLLYVGLTRAKHLAIAWHAPRSKRCKDAMTALLWRDRTTDELPEHFVRQVGTGPDTDLVMISQFGDAPVERRPLPAATAVPQQVATLGRQIDQAWRRTSYSGLTAGLHALAPTGLVDEPAALDMEMVESPVPGLLSPMNGLPAGAAFGSLVHAILERLDWAPNAVVDDSRRVVAALASQHGLADEHVAPLADAVVAVCTTPLGRLAPGLSLSDIPVAQRLPELDFDLPLADHASPARLAQVAQAMARHLPADDPLAGYPAHLLGTPAADELLSGFLTGSIDAVLRTGEGRFLIVDYKTNRLPVGPAEELSVGHYRAAAMAGAMISSHYPLQAILYCAALHRYLGWRLPGYSADQHLGGVGYLFVRGMAGPGTPVIDADTCGVFTWQPPAALVVEVSELLGGTR